MTPRTRTKRQSPSTPEIPAGGLAEWRHRSEKIRGVVLPSGMTVDLKVMRLEDLASVDALPEHLQKVSYLIQTGVFEEALNERGRALDMDGGQDLIDGNSQLVNRLVKASIAGPPQLVADLAALDPDDPLEMIDGFDKQMIAEIVQRLRETDATRRRVYGAQPLGEFPEAGSE